jgi:hypothetical protein
VRMVESRSELNLTAEALDVHSRGEIDGKNLDHHLTLEVGFGGDEYPGHAAARQLPFNFVRCPDGFLKTLLEVGCQAGAHLVKGKTTPGRLPERRIWPKQRSL